MWEGDGGSLILGGGALIWPLCSEIFLGSWRSCKSDGHFLKGILAKVQHNLVAEVLFSPNKGVYHLLLNGKATLQTMTNNTSSSVH